jgi:hypothetical protein
LPTLWRRSGYRIRFYLTLLALGASGACASALAAAGTTSTLDKETGMTTSEHSANQGQSTLTSKDALSRMLELIRGIQSVNDVTPEYMGKVMGTKITVVDPDKYGFGQSFSKDWAGGIQRSKLISGATQLDFSFTSKPGEQPSAAEVCDPDFGQFTAELEAMGLARQSHYGEHGRWLYDYFDGRKMRVEVHAMDVSPQVHGDNGAAAKACVKMVIVR